MFSYWLRPEQRRHGMTHETMKVIEDREILHKAESDGPRVRRVQKILNTKTGDIATVRFWYDSNNNLYKVQ